MKTGPFISVIAAALILAGCVTSQPPLGTVAMERAFALCGKPSPELTPEERQKRQACYQQTYPQFFTAETQERAAIDAQRARAAQNLRNIQYDAPKQTYCNGVGKYVSCTTY